MSGQRTNPAHSAAGASPSKARWGALRLIGDVWQRLGANGAFPGTSGGPHVFLLGIFGIALIVGAVDIVNAITIIHNRPQVNPLEPFIWEATSGVAMLAAAWIPWKVLCWFPPARGLSFAMVTAHLVAAPVFSLCHVGGFELLRTAILAAAGAHYTMGPPLPTFLYELSKDIFAYALIVSVFLVAERLLRERPQPAQAETMFAIRDGARLTRVAFDDILAVNSAGNYVEFVLRDGRRLLMRSALTQIEAQFTPRGFVRVHRSWLVNPARMTGLSPNGSGDYTVALGELAVPLSRRFPEAVARLRAH